MGSNQHQQVDVDPHALAESRRLWDNFTKAITIAIVAHVIGLGLMALFLL